MPVEQSAPRLPSPPAPLRLKTRAAPAPCALVSPLISAAAVHLLLPQIPRFSSPLALLLCLFLNFGVWGKSAGGARRRQHPMELLHRR